MHVFSTFRVGGPQVRFALMANCWGNRYHHAVLAMDGAYDCVARLAPEICIERLNLDTPKRRTLRNVMEFRRYLHTHRPDLLVTYNWGAMEWALANRPRIVPHVHIEDGFGVEEADGQLWRRVLARRLGLARSIVVLPSLTLHRLALREWRLPAVRVRHIPNGIDLARFTAPAQPISLPPGPGPVIGTVAALRPEKNITRLLRAFRGVLEITPCRLVIAGDGPEKGRLESLARETLPPASFVFTGDVSEVERVYRSIDIFAMSSDTEQMPTSLMEAMASGLPVAATNVGDTAEMVSSANRVFIAQRTEHSLADALYRVVVDESARRAAGDGNRLVAVARFGMSAMLSSYDSLFYRLAIAKRCEKLRETRKPAGVATEVDPG
jgi:glycosyltransferase involved in cell wall biosynthesis